MRKAGMAGAYLTVYLTLTLGVMLSLCLALIEGVRSNGIRIEAECITDIGLNSVLAEYHRELFTRYNLFAVDASYGTAYAGVSNTQYHLQQYLDRNATMQDIFLEQYAYKDFFGISFPDVEVTKVSILTDDKGTVFRRRAAEVVWNDSALGMLEDLKKWIDVVEGEGLNERNLAEEKDAVDRQIQSYDGSSVQISETEAVVLHVDNPTWKLNEKRKTGILKWVVEDADELSDCRISQDNLIYDRMERGEINIGNWPKEEPAKGGELLERFFFQEFLLMYLGSYGGEEKGEALRYQIEYLIAGRDSDVDNLKYVANTLCAIREAANAIYLFSDAEKCAEAELAAAALAGVLLVPELTPLFKVTLLLGWAYAESLYDVEALLAGGRIPLIKDKSTWHYSLAAALGADGTGDASMEDRGLCYEDYLRVLMMLTGTEVLTGRAMNMVEADIRTTQGNAGFRLDGCYDGLEVLIQVRSTYGYAYEIRRQKRYTG